jgi:hypothetical protein
MIRVLDTMYNTHFLLLHFYIISNVYFYHILHCYGKSSLFQTIPISLNEILYRNKTLLKKNVLIITQYCHRVILYYVIMS